MSTRASPACTRTAPSTRRSTPPRCGSTASGSAPASSSAGARVRRRSRRSTCGYRRNVWARASRTTDLEPLTASGWYVSGTWVLTGEKKADNLAAPLRPLFRGGWGAIEAAARVEGMRFGSVDTEIASTSPRADVVLGNADHAVTLGVNWHPDALRQGAGERRSRAPRGSRHRSGAGLTQLLEPRGALPARLLRTDHAQTISRPAARHPGSGSHRRAGRGADQ